MEYKEKIYNMWWLNSTLAGATLGASYNSFHKSYTDKTTDNIFSNIFSNILWTGGLWINFGQNFIYPGNYKDVGNRSFIYVGIITANLFSLFFLNNEITKSGKAAVECDVTDFDGSANNPKIENQIKLTHTDTINKICHLTPFFFSSVAWLGAYLCENIDSTAWHKAIEVGCIGSIIFNLALEFFAKEKYTLEVTCNKGELVLVSEFEDNAGNMLSNYSDVNTMNFEF